MRSQSIRPSQFITTYGPGSILEGPDGPRIVLSLEHSNVYGTQPVVTYAIQAPGMSQILPDQAQIVRLPTNAERQVRDGEYIYVTDAFPRWSLCVEHNILYRYQNNSLRTGCPQCAPHPQPFDAWRRSRREAIRFVMACPAGHLDDVNWPALVHQHSPGCSPSFLLWQGGGGALRNIVIRCPNCPASMNLGTAYGRKWNCSGAFPERRLSGQGCQRDAHITQRGAANLHVAELITSITIPNMDTELHQALACNQIKPLLLAMQGLITSGGHLRQMIQNASAALPPSVMASIAKYDDDRIFQAMNEVLATVLPDTPHAMRLSEFSALQRAATYGHPSQPSLTPGAPPMFEVIPGHVRPNVPGPGGNLWRITPVSRLRVVMVQQGYRRLDGGTDDLVPTTYVEGQNRWLPGVELHGEGIFVDLSPPSGTEAADAHIPMTGDDAANWGAEWQSNGDLRTHPVFVWWHTLAHRLILALAIDSGYSSASVRERVYTRVNHVTGIATGGVLLYTAQPGGDGTLGGLIALVPRFERVLGAALANIDSCSNDPLCNEEHFAPGRCNGAACYACSLISETSCEFRNMYLDRNLLRIHLP